MPELRLLRLLCVLVTAVTLAGQSPLTTTFAHNHGIANGGMMFFDLDVTEPAGVQILGMDIHTNAATGGITFWTTPTTWLGNAANPAAWTSRGTGGFTTFVGPGQPTPVCFNGGFFLPQGQYGVAIEASPSTNLLLTVGTAPFPLTYATNELTLTAGAAANAPFTGAPFAPRVINTNIHYNVGAIPGSCPVLGSLTPYGTGCIAQFATFYETLTTAGFDLTNFDITGTDNGAGYSVTVAPGVGILPVGGVGAATTLVMGDDNQVPAGTLGMVVGSNGWVALGGGNSNSWSPNPAFMLNNPAEAVYAWTDLLPNASGTVTYEENAATGATRTTYDGVFGWNTLDPHYIQIDFNTITGDWVIRFGTVGFANPEDWLVGYSPANPNMDPGSQDLTVTTSFTIPALDVPPLTLSGNVPRVANNWQLTTGNIDPLSPFAVTFFGDRGPAIPLPTLGLAAPECDANLATIVGNITVANVGGVGVATLAIPNNTALVGLNISAQSVCLTAMNAAGLLTSAGVEGTIGS